MAITEHDRHLMYQHLEEVLGSETATKLMEHLPPVGWADVATKRDIDQLAIATKRDIDQLAIATKHDIDQLRGDFKHDIDRLRGDFDGLRGELDHRFESFADKLRAEMADLRSGIEHAMRQQLMWMIGAMTAWAAVIVAAVKI
jgi:hypothetical protein